MTGKCLVCGEEKERFGIPVLPNMQPTGLIGQQQAQMAFFAFEVCNECVELGLIYLCKSARAAAMPAPEGPIETIKIVPQENPDAPKEEGP